MCREKQQRPPSQNTLVMLVPRHWTMRIELYYTLLAERVNAPCLHALRQGENQIIVTARHLRGVFSKECSGCVEIFEENAHEHGLSQP